MKNFNIKTGKWVAQPEQIKMYSKDEILDYVRNLPFFKTKKQCLMVLSIVLVKSWEPKDEAGRLALIQHLDDTLSLPIYTTAFPELTPGPGGVLDTIHKFRVMGEYLVGGSNVGESDAKKVNTYKHSYFVGPVGTSMAIVPTATSYGLVVPAETPADVMGYIRTLRGKLMRNNNWSDDIAKALWLYGTDGESFVAADYVAHYSVHAFPGYMHFHVSTKNVHIHHIYIRKAGTTVWDAPIIFTGANFDVHRISSTTPELLEVMILGFYDNVETVLPSVITPVTYRMPLV